MKSLILSFFMCTFISLNGADNFHINKFNKLEHEQLKVAVDGLEELIAESLVYRKRILQFVKNFEKNERVLTGADLEKIQQTISSQLKLRESFYRYLNTYKDRVLSREENIIDKANTIKGGLIGLASASVLYDNFALCLSVVHENGKLRRLINKGNKGFDIQKNTLEEVVESFHSPDKRDDLREALEWLDDHSDEVKTMSKSDEQVAYLSKVLSDSPSINDVRDGYEFGDYVKFLTLIPGAGKDKIISAGEVGMNSVSKIFGNSVGLVQTRKGKLFKASDEVQRIKSRLKPMDILLEKTPFRLTDKFIPGHFGHVAIWVGSEKELKSMGLWDHPVIKPHQNHIRNGKSVLEALRDGVQLSTFEKFMDVDDVAVLRAKKGDFNNYCIRSFRQLGKDYDFNFDVETIDKIVCSELVYQVYTDIKWPTEKTLGRHTISPDNVAVKVGEGNFDLVLFYHDGKASTFDKYKNLVEAQ